MHGHRPPPCTLSLLLSILQFLLFSSNTTLPPPSSLRPRSLAPRITTRHHSPSATTTWPHHGCREDCWSDGAPDTLIEAWGGRYINLNRANVGQKDWKEVADTVNNRQNGVKPKKTDVLCKNRMASYSETSSDDDEDDMAWFEERLKKKRHRMEDAGYLMGLRVGN
ncbi:hypothetical protein POTOM_036583 [Populus tomentosa]|uniref:Myb/SANT-like DNA-binding domain-containing protein n=1 Tax=Populus tomentosa TaxID=118781 RepID=A0A8X7Z360_POPTO|nr:hypothetical protein POTOM_036583 [Populus tomentosa]